MPSIATVIDALPDALAQKFSSDSKSSTLSILAAQSFEEWFDNSGMPFFAHYTDHTFRHAMEVFYTAVELIPQESHPVVTSIDISILFLACLTHDCGMHLTERQFQVLRALDTPTDYCGTTEPSWKDMWEDFLQDARRFNDEKLRTIFGDTRPVTGIPDNEDDFTNRDRALIGEFLRRNHPRIAYEIATGLGQTLGGADPLHDFPDPIRVLIGLVARSHGEALRKNLDHIAQEFDLRDFQGIHVIYLMALVRIADLGQIQSSRAPTIFSKLHAVRSPISAREWRVHQSVLFINQAHEDPEALYVESRPTNVVDFSRVKSWLEELQRELDLTWAILGEVYGRHRSPALDMLKLRIRRVRSNVLENSGKFPFVPEAFSFRVAEAEMLSLLLSPLYGDHAAYGLRELVQNARDASEEREVSESGSILPPVVVHVYDLADRNEITIKDAGVGMTLDVIKSYFLNAGASFRSSDKWRAKFEDDAGNIKVMRSGRFGVGALAAFLLGPSITVTTRHFLDTSGKGYTFTCSLDDKEIEIREVQAETGTIISVQSSPDRIRQLHNSHRALRDLFRFSPEKLQINFIGEDSNYTIEHNDNREFIEVTDCSVKDHLNATSSYYRFEYTYGGGRVSSSYINGIAVAEVRDESLFFTGSLYKRRALTSPVDFPGYYGSGDADPQVGFVLEVEDRRAVAQVNLARTNVISYDKLLTEKIDYNIFKHFKSEMQNYFELISKSDRFTNEKDWFSISAQNVAFVSREIIPNDITIMVAYGVKHVVRVIASPSQLMALSGEFPGYAFVYGTPPTSATEGQHYLRDLKYSFSLSESNTAVVKFSLEWRKKITESRGAAKWMQELLNEGDDFDWISFGPNSADLEQTMESLFSLNMSENIEIFSNIDADFRWRRWSSERPAKVGVFADMWLGKSARP